MSFVRLGLQHRHAQLEPSNDLFHLSILHKSLASFSCLDAQMLMQANIQSFLQ